MVSEPAVPVSDYTETKIVFLLPKLAEKSFIASETNTSSVLYFYISLLYSKTKQDTEKFVEVKTHISPKHVFLLKKFFFSFFDFGFFLSFEFFFEFGFF